MIAALGHALVELAFLSRSLACARGTRPARMAFEHASRSLVLRTRVAAMVRGMLLIVTVETWLRMCARAL
jgi:hypothetical protein